MNNEAMTELRIMLERLESRLEQKIDGVERRMDGFEQRFDGLEKKMDHLDKKIDDVESRLEQKIDGVNSQIDGVETKMDKLAHCTALKAAVEVTVEIWCLNAPGGFRELASRPDAHGMIVKAVDAGTTVLAVATAAHVVVECLKSDKNSGNQYFVRCKGAGTGGKQLDLQGVGYVPKRYIFEGAADVGLILLESCDVNVYKTSRAVLTEGGPAPMAFLTGTGAVNVQGCVVQDDAAATGRLLVHATTIGGTSGTPLVDDDGRIIACVHGDSPHRRHANDSDGVDTESKPSSIVYADMFTELFGKDLAVVHAGTDAAKRLALSEDSEIARRLRSGVDDAAKKEAKDLWDLCLHSQISLLHPEAFAIGAGAG